MDFGQAFANIWGEGHRRAKGIEEEGALSDSKSSFSGTCMLQTERRRQVLEQAVPVCSGVTQYLITHQTRTR
eukprot:scaffold48052_cov63-Phaeocystis_antarctica.AAC.2